MVCVFVCVVMGLVEIGVGHGMVGWFFLVFDGFFFLFFFILLIWVFVPVGFWWAVGSGGLGFSGFLFRWVFVPLGFSGLIIGVFWVFLTAWFFWVDHWLQLVWWIVCVWLCLRFDGLCFCVCVCVAVCVWWWVWIGWLVYNGFVCWIGARGWGRERKKKTIGKPRKTKSYG